MRRCTGDDGTGLISTVGGVTAFLVFLLLATQTLVALHATSTVTGVAFDGARSVARAEPAEVPAAQRRAEGEMRQMLGRLAVEFDWSASTADEVVLVVRAAGPRVLPIGWGGGADDPIVRTVRVRREVPR